MASTNQTKVSNSIHNNIFAAQNATAVEVVENGKIVHRESADLKVGQVIVCRDGCTFPADIALLSSSDNGDCFIKTSSLDGEKNLKKRVQPKDMGKIFPVNDLNVLPTFN
jgi:P-type E1-E2 ATPase